MVVVWLRSPSDLSLRVAVPPVLRSRTLSSRLVDAFLLRVVRPLAVAAGGRHSLALSSTGAVYGWGWNYHGQLGQQPDGANGGSHFVLSAVEMDMGDVGAATAVAAGDLYSAAVG